MSFFLFKQLYLVTTDTVIPGLSTRIVDYKRVDDKHDPLRFQPENVFFNLMFNISLIEKS